MRKVAMATTLVMVMVGAAAAQTGNSTSWSGKQQQQPWPAPTGHRQPRLDQVPDTSSGNDAVKREDAELDRKLKSICRGC